MTDKPLSDHFMLSEFTLSETAERNGIDNTPSEEILQNLVWNASNLEAVRSLLNAPLHISSGYRCPQLNVLVGSKPTSAHVLGLAADFIAPHFGKPIDVCDKIMHSGIPFDQLIMEFAGGGKGWTHIGWAKFGDHPRRQVLTIDRNGTHPGIVKLEAV